MKNKTNKQFFAVFTQLPNGKFKVKKAQQLTKLNQYRKKWVGVNARKLSRDINNNSLVIN